MSETPHAKTLKDRHTSAWLAFCRTIAERCREKASANGLFAEASIQLQWLLQEIAALRQPQSGTWQPIETAPKDWTHVLMYDCVDGAVCEAYYRDDEELWCRANVSTEDEDSILAGPTHWMPLPSPPQTETPR